MFLSTRIILIITIVYNNTNIRDNDRCTHKAFIETTNPNNFFKTNLFRNFTKNVYIFYQFFCCCENSDYKQLNLIREI